MFKTQTHSFIKRNQCLGDIINTTRYPRVVIWSHLKIIYVASQIIYEFVCCFSLNGEDIRLMLWDTAGQEEFDCITRAYYRLIILIIN